jgi:BirA family biotin operon repressor/biotin-[acetyl-CoA-carboxylase] ligase
MKDKILEELKNKQGTYISGEEISSRLQVSRTAIWKYINQLKSAGYVIQSQTKKGYSLLETPDCLLPSEMRPLLNTEFLGHHMEYLEQVDSTNLYAKKLAEASFENGTVVFAEEQTKGKGRLGRQWISPKGKGIFMTLMLKPRMAPSEAAKITLLTACAVTRAIEEAAGIQAQIKWPNDIVVGGRKLCGILTEMGAEMDEINYLIVGIGINVNLEQQELPEELWPIATSLRIEKGEKQDRKRLAASVLNRFEGYYKSFTETGSIASFIEEYKEKCAVMGKEVRMISSSHELQGTVTGISQEGQLMLRLADGSTREIISGEISLRALEGYV